QTTRWLRTDDSADTVSPSRSSFVASDLCLAGLRCVSKLSSAQQISWVLAADPRRAALFGHRGSCAPDSSRRDPRPERRIPAELSAGASPSVLSPRAGKQDVNAREASVFTRVVHARISAFTRVFDALWRGHNGWMLSGPVQNHWNPL